MFNVYGSNNAPLNNKLLSEISDSLFELKLVYPTDNIIIGGDFNMVMDEAIDRFPHKFDASHSNLTLLNFCFKHNVVDAWRPRNVTGQGAFLAPPAVCVVMSVSAVRDRCNQH